MITQNEEKIFFEFISGWRDRLLSTWRPHVDDLLWHYTTGEGLIGIITSGKIFATQASCLNDNTEIRYAAGLLRLALLERAQRPSSDKARSFLLNFAAILDDTDSKPNHAGSFHFVTCFSGLMDDLSQWRSYGGGENGYAIGVRARDLLNVEATLIGSVNYDRELQKAIADEVAEKTVELYTHGLSSRDAVLHDQWARDFLAKWDNNLSALAPFAKHSSFQSEREFRMVHTFLDSDYTNLVVRQRSTLMARHLPLCLPAGLTDGKQKFPVAMVLVGPARHKAVSAISIATLLRKEGYDSNIPVLTSEIPYQQT